MFDQNILHCKTEYPVYIPLIKIIKLCTDCGYVELVGENNQTTYLIQLSVFNFIYVDDSQQPAP